MKHLYKWVDLLFDRYSYTGKIRFVGAMVISLCIFCIGMNLYLQHDYINMYESKEKGLAEFRRLTALLRASSNLQLFLAAGHSVNDQKYQAEIVGHLADFDRLVHSTGNMLHQSVQDTSVWDLETILESNKQLDLMHGLWTNIQNELTNNKKPPHKLLKRFDRKVLFFIRRNSEVFRLDQGIEFIIYALTYVTLGDMPSAQNHLTNLATGFRTPSSQTEGGVEDQIQAKALGHKLENIRSMIVQAEKENITSGNQFQIGQLMEYFTPYESAVKAYLDHFAKKGAEQKEGLISAQAALTEGWKTEELFLQSLEEDIQFALNVLYNRQTQTIIITIVGFLIFLTLYLTRLMRRPLEMLASAANALSHGDLTVRVPVTVKDEVSKIIIAFNEMASSWEQNVYKAKLVANKLVGISSSMFDIAGKLEGNLASQEELIESMKSQANKIADLIQDFKEILEKVRMSVLAASAKAEIGRTGLSEMEEVTTQMGGAARLIVDTLSLIEGQVDRIKSVLNVIVSIADQSNILTLNTAIRANQSGETGGGFTVVAGKIRELAEQTAIATLDIEKAVHEIVSDVANAIVEVERFSTQISGQVNDERSVHETLSRRIDLAQQQVETFDHIYSDMEHLFTDTLNIDGMMSNLAKVSAQTGRSVRKVYNDAERLSKKTEGLQAMIARFRLKHQQ